LAPDLRHNLYLIYKEALHNVVKHARATTVTVQLAATTAGLALTVADDGCGYNSHLRPGGHGLVNMQVRAQAVGGTVRYAPQPAGFAVVVILPMK
jgi:signal transduction histidine kinase